jgi:hypothetical protein
LKTIEAGASGSIGKGFTDAVTASVAGSSTGFSREEAR